ncbi:tail fiber protein [Vibrio phage D80]
MNPEIQPLVENIEILNGARGSGLDRAVLLRDLVDLGLAGTVKTSGGKVRPVTGTPGTGTPGGGTSPTPDPTVEDPVAPTGVYASGGFSNILIAWDSPGYKGHAYANIYRSATDDYSQAVAISQTAANLYSDTVAVGATWYYWIRFVNKNDKEGPIQSTNGVKGTTSAAIGDILDQLKGEIDETFFTPVFNTRLDDTDKDIQQLFGDVTNIDNKFTDKFVQVEDQFVEFDGKFVDVNSIIDELKEAGEIIAEAAMSAAVGVEIESDTRRKITARIEEKQRTIITDQIAMAEDIKTVTATVDDNKAQISINNTALVELDKDTKEAVKTITERLDTQQSNIDDNKASITNQQQTLVSVQDSVNKNTGEIDATKQDVQAVTTRLDKQQSEIDDNKATITTQQQTIITIDGKVTGNADDIKDTADKVEVITQRVDTLTSEVGDNKAQISQTQQTLITIDGKVTDNEKEIGDNAKSIQVVTTRIDQQQSEIDSNKATITSQSQTIIKIDGEVQKNKADVEKAITAASNAQATADGKIDTFFQDSHPANASSGDIWFDTNDGNKQYIYHNGAWIVAQDTAIGDAILAAAGAQATADGKIETFYQPDAPTASAKGDLWVDTDDKNKLYRWSGSAWVDIHDQNIDEIKGDVEVITQRVDTMKSEVDNNTAEITDTKQTLVTIDGKVSDNANDIADANQSITTMTQRLESQQSEIDGNKASITSQAQTIVTIDGKVSQNASDIDTANKSIETITQKQDEQKSELDGAKAVIESNSQTIARIEGELGEDGDNSQEILAEAVMSSAIGVDNEGSTRRKVTARIEKQQRVIMTDQSAMAQELTIITASVADNKAEIKSVNTALVEFDKETEQALKVMTERLDTQKANIDDNTASITTQQQTIVTIDGKVQDNTEEVAKAIASASNAQATADGKIDTFFQDGEPQAASEGDLWFDTDNGNKQHVYKNGAWIVAQDTAIGDAILAAATAQSTADGKITTFYVPDAPKAKAVGDLWVDTNDKNKLYRWSGSNWLDIQDGNINEIDGKVTVITERLDQLKSEVDGNTASITTNSQTIIEVNSKAEANESKINVVSQQLTTVESELGDTKSAVSTNSQTIAKMNADGTTAYEAQWGVKASVGDVQAGIGLVAKKNPDGTTTSQCTVLADQFSVGHVNTDGDDETIYPFIVTSEGVYIDTAYIKAATVQELVAGEVIADTVKASASITAPKIKGGTIEIGSNFSVDENGNATTNNIKGNNVHLTGYINATSGTFRGTVYATTGEFKGTVYATDGDFKGTVYANRIVGDVVTANTKKKSNSVGYFDRARVNKPTSKNRTLQFTVMVGLKAKGYRDQEGRFQPSTVEGRLKVTGTYGTRYSQIFSFSTNRSSEESRFFPVNVSIPIPANTTGTVNIYSEKTHSVGETSVVTSAPTTDGIWTAMLFTDGSDLS